jgi:prevent-host-death family protein
MCYMREEPRLKLERLGVRELRQNLSQYLARVAAAEGFEVTERNLPVAILAPLPGRRSALERLVADDRIVPARLDLMTLGPPKERPHGMTISEALAAQRREG